MESEKLITPEVYIPVDPDKKKRFRIAAAVSVPAFLLIIASLSTFPDTTGGMVLKYFNIVVAILILVINYRNYKSPLKSGLFGTDTSLVLSGLLILAQGASTFDPVKGFQPAHLLFLAGFFSIFKGVMLPDAKIRRGFVVTDEKIRFRKRLISKVIEIKRSHLTQINLSENNLIFILSNAKDITISLDGFENAGKIHTQLIDAIR